MRIRRPLRRLCSACAGVTSIEYAMIAALIALVIFSAVRLVGLQTAANIERAADAVTEAAP